VNVFADADRLPPWMAAASLHGRIYGVSVSANTFNRRGNEAKKIK
jgi:hypothetical protein